VPNLKYPELFHLNASQAFDMEHAAGQPAPHNGIYRCRCGHETPAHEGAPLPSDPHPLHPAGQPVAWTLTAAARRNEAAPAPITDFRSPDGWPPLGG
jgi:hypothetical protein